jgi:2-polyprenyl-6-methoxyphenol hydroxylase-like FAD-dependent oxidoreductase
MSIDDLPVEAVPGQAVIIAGGGPVGLLLALTLAHHGVRSVVLERSPTTTQ